MAAQVFGPARATAAREVALRREHTDVAGRDLARDQRGVAQLSAADREIDAFATRSITRVVTCSSIVTPGQRSTMRPIRRGNSSGASANPRPQPNAPRCEVHPPTPRLHWPTPAAGRIRSRAAATRSRTSDTDLNLRLSVADRDPAETRAARTSVGRALSSFRDPAYTLRVAPDQPERSALLQRMRSTDTRQRMPPLASERVDARGVAAVRAWIDGL